MFGLKRPAAEDQRCSAAKPAAGAACPASGVESECPTCGFSSAEIRCPRCFALKVRGCSGSCSHCG